jgi:hypothetical protein
MKDGIGQPLHKGNLVQVMIGQQPIRGFILDLREGGITLSINKNQPQAMTPDIVILQVEVPLVDSQPGQIHPAMIRLPVPDKEVIMPVAVRTN